MKKKIKDILRKRFPEEAAIDVSDGYKNNIHIVVVSMEFEGLGEKEKQDLLWNAIDQSDLSEEEKLRISLIVPYSPRELK